jgi:hypothetical protein
LVIKHFVKEIEFMGVHGWDETCLRRNSPRVQRLLNGAVVHLVKAADCGVCQPAVVGIVVVDACPGGRAVPGDRSSDQRDTVRACLKSRATRYAPCRQQPHRDAVAHPVSGPARASFCSRATATTCLTFCLSTRVRLTIVLLYPRAISSIMLNARTAHF